MAKETEHVDRLLIKVSPFVVILVVLVLVLSRCSAGNTPETSYTELLKECEADVPAEQKDLCPRMVNLYLQMEKDGLTN